MSTSQCLCYCADHRDALIFCDQVSSAGQGGKPQNSQIQITSEQLTKSVTRIRTKVEHLNRGCPLQCLPPLTQTGLSSATRQLRQRNNAESATDNTLIEVFGETATDGAVTGFVSAHLHNATKPVLWIQDRLSQKEAGRPYLAGLPVALDIIHVNVSRPKDVLWSMEEGLRCTGLSAIIGEIWGDPAVLDFTATKRLALRAEARGLPAFLMRRAGNANLSAARLRWRIASLPAAHNPHDSRAPGEARWRADLFRARWRAPGGWVASHDTTGLHLAHATAQMDTAQAQAL